MEQICAGPVLNTSAIAVCEHHVSASEQGSDANFDGRLQKNEFFKIARDKQAVKALKAAWQSLHGHEEDEPRSR